MLKYYTACKAFSLFELVIYMGSLSIFIFLGFSFFTKNYKNILFDLSENRKNIRNLSINSLLHRDIAMADYQVINWDIKNFVFKIMHSDTDVSYFAKQDGLFRISGSYDYLNKKWLKKNIARLNYDIKNFLININLDKTKAHILSVSIKYNNQDIFIKLRNRVIACE
ncbi:hypothetical protein KJ644_01335 [Candidatus Dependentiae bacterium]|nr:hypothetical protein [Candidatus Dependentiae bacterium]MBU4387094.1 hypothetical protein [Candidatus Dependentiae bacterium]MCG2756245.1 hypothetical protein [Candidatus Dependentiae bacterium]